jgi:hypothetical protein
VIHIGGGGYDLNKCFISGLVLVLLLIGCATPAFGGLEGALEYRYTNSQWSYSLQANYWFTDRLAVSGSYDLQDHSLSAAFLYKTNPFLKGTTTYIGLGVRDLNDSYHSGLDLSQRIELTAGAGYSLKRVVPGLSVSLEAKMIPNQLFNGNQSSKGFAPILGFSIGYRLPGQRTPGSDTTVPPSDSDIYLLAKLITAEAGDEPYDGQVAVGAVVLNRTRSGEFPTSIREVIYQPGQFSSLPKLPTITPSASCMKAAEDALNGVDPSRGALYFYNPATSSPEGLRFFATADLRVTVRIGNHVFLK